MLISSLEFKTSSRPTPPTIADENLSVAAKDASILVSETLSVHDVTQSIPPKVRVLDGDEPLSDEIMDFVLRKNEELYRRLA
jgi:hypothetical protein